MDDHWALKLSHVDQLRSVQRVCIIMEGYARVLQMDALNEYALEIVRLAMDEESLHAGRVCEYAWCAVICCVSDIYLTIHRDPHHPRALLIG